MRDTYTIEEAARKLGIGRNSCYDAARAGQIPIIKIGKRMLVPKAELDRLLGLVPDQGGSVTGGGR
jgi:excisionase family DNA binding protein